MVDAIGCYTAMFDYFQDMVIHQKVTMIVIVVKTFSGEESNPGPIDKSFASAGCLRLVVCYGVSTN